MYLAKTILLERRNIMRRLIVLTVIIIIGLCSLAFAQNMVSNPGFENWTGGVPDGWYGVKSNIGEDNVIQYTASVHSGSSACQLINIESSHKRFTTQALTIVDETEYTITFWVRGHGEIRTGLYGGGSSWIYNDYISVNSTDWSQKTQTITATQSTDEAEFIFSLRNTNEDLDHLQIDDVEITPPTGNPSISKAYSITLTDMDILYNLEVTSVNASDYTLTGTVDITFSSATIDGDNPKLVHLTGASENMIADLTLDNIYDDANETEYDFYAGITPIALLNTNNPGGHIDNSELATFQGIVSANDNYNNVWLSDASGAYNGVVIFDYNFDELVAVGDEILFTATRDEYNNLTELKNPTLLSVISQGNEPYAATVINGVDIDSTLTANSDPAEQWEGQLVVIQDAYIEEVVMDSVNGVYYALCTDDEGATHFYVGDNVDYHFENITLIVGKTVEFIGVVDWDVYNDYYRINPRYQDDVPVDNYLNPKTSFILYQNYPNPVRNSTTICFNLSTNSHKDARIEIYNVKGQLVKTLLPHPTPHLSLTTVEWDATDENSKPVSNGIYFYKLKLGDKSITKKMLLMK